MNQLNQVAKGMCARSTMTFERITTDYIEIVTARILVVDKEQKDLGFVYSGDGSIITVPRDELVRQTKDLK